MREMQIGRSFVGFEYKEITVDAQKASLFLDGYASFGWIPDENLAPAKTMNKTTIRLKRNRKILNKTELTRLQRHFETCAEEIDSMECSIESAGNLASIPVGIVGTAFMAGAVFAVTNDPPIIWLCVLLAIPAFAGWILPLFLYREAVRRRKKKINPLIEQKYDELYEICEKGSNLLNGR